VGGQSRRHSSVSSCEPYSILSNLPIPHHNIPYNRWGRRDFLASLKTFVGDMDQVGNGTWDRALIHLWSSREENREQPAMSFRGPPQSLWNFLFLVVIFPLVIYALLVATGTPTASAGAILELYFILLLVAFVLYVFGKINRRL